MDKIVTIPPKMLDVQDGTAGPRNVNAFIYFLSLVIETVPHKTETDGFLAYKLREKIDSLKPGTKTMILTSEERSFIDKGLENLRGQSRMAGSGWYYLLSPLQDAKPATKEK